MVKLLIERGCKLHLKGKVTLSKIYFFFIFFFLFKIINFIKRAESALDRAKSDSVREILSKHYNINNVVNVNEETTEINIR